MWRRVGLVKTDVSEERISSVFKILVEKYPRALLYLLHKESSYGPISVHLCYFEAY
jgi:hypothetical protein